MNYVLFLLLLWLCIKNLQVNNCCYYYALCIVTCKNCEKVKFCEYKTIFISKIIDNQETMIYKYKIIYINKLIKFKFEPSKHNKLLRLNIYRRDQKKSKKLVAYVIKINHKNGTSLYHWYIQIFLTLTQN